MVMHDDLSAFGYYLAVFGFSFCVGWTLAAIFSWWRGDR